MTIAVVNYYYCGDDLPLEMAHTHIYTIATNFNAFFIIILLILLHELFYTVNRVRDET